LWPVFGQGKCGGTKLGRGKGLCQVGRRMYLVKEI
jgi:hypothetical protein